MPKKPNILDETPVAVPDSADTAAQETADTRSAVSISSKPIDGTRGFVFSQRLFLLLALCMALFSVYDTYSNQPEDIPPAMQQPFDVLGIRAEAGPTGLADAMNRIAQRRIFGPPPVMDAPPPGPVAIRGWRAEVREQWELKGTSSIPGETGPSAREAIVFDKRSQRLQFLRAGETRQIVQQSVAIVRVDADRVELRSGDEIFVLD